MTHTAWRRLELTILSPPLWILAADILAHSAAHYWQASTRSQRHIPVTPSDLVFVERWGLTFLHCVFSYDSSGDEDELVTLKDEVTPSGRMGARSAMLMPVCGYSHYFAFLLLWVATIMGDCYYVWLLLCVATITCGYSHYFAYLLFCLATTVFGYYHVWLLLWVASNHWLLSWVATIVGGYLHCFAAYKDSSLWAQSVSPLEKNRHNQLGSLWGLLHKRCKNSVKRKIGVQSRRFILYTFRCETMLQMSVS